MAIINISALRLHRQQISQPNYKEACEVLSWMGAIQGQDYTGAKWSIGLRMAKATDTEVENALAQKKILRTWLMRGTLHMVAAADIGWMLSLFAPRIIKGNARRYKELELDEQTLLKSNDVLANALFKKKVLNRKELLSILEQNKISTNGQRAAYMLQRASYDGLICQTTTIKNTPNYILLDEVNTKSENKIRDEAIAELTLRYFKSRGPATLQDFVWWSGLTVSDARQGLEANKFTLIEETFESQKYWLSPDVQLVKQNESSLYILPGFDEYLLGYKDRIASLDPQHNTKWCPGNNGMFFPFVVVNGRVVGVWKRTFKKDCVSIEVNGFGPKAMSSNPALMAAVNQYIKFMQMKLDPRGLFIQE